MEIKEIKIPRGTRYLGNWKDFKNKLPTTGRNIINKQYTGVGLTTYFLKNESNIILLSPRLELLKCKAEDKELKNRVHWFNRSGETKEEHITRTLQRLYNYLQYTSVNPNNLPQQYLEEAFPAKILVTYDSSFRVIDYLRDLGLLDKFTIVIDEMQALLVDSGFKSNCELQTLMNLMKLDNTMFFISATPFSEEYLSEMKYFKDMTYYKLEWSKADKEDVALKTIKTDKTPREICAEIIRNYRNNGYFDFTINSEGKEEYSREAAFYLNRVTDIVNIIRENKLKPDEVTIICANNDANRRRLREVGVSIGHFNKKEDMNLNTPYTFITRCSFDGADYYTNTATTYIFSNCNSKTLSLDISIDLVQIVGRIRTPENLFRNQITLYFRTPNGAIGNILPYMENEQEFQDYITSKRELAEKLIKEHENSSQETLLSMKEGQEKNKLSRSYFDVVEVDGVLQPTINFLALYNDLRAYQIFKKQYRTTLQTLKNIREAGFTVNGESNPVVKEVNGVLLGRGNFEDKMKYFCNFLDNNPENKDAVLKTIMIPQIYRLAYKVLGSDKCKALSYHEADIRAQLDTRTKRNNITEELKKAFKRGDRVVNKDAKKILADIYSRLGLKIKAKATDIGLYLPIKKKIKVTVENGKQKDGIMIL